MTALLARWTEKLAGGPHAGTSYSPPLARGMGVGKQQQGFDYGDEGQHNADANNNGQKCARSSLIQKLQKHFGDVSLCYVHKINGQLE